MPRPDDRELVQRCRDGDDDAWGQLVERYENLVYSAALRTGLPREDCDDAYQRTWLELHRSLHRLQDAKALPRWLAVTARRQALKIALKQQRSVGEPGEDLLDPGPRADERLQELEARQALHDALPRLGRRCRELLQMLFLEEPRPAYKEIGRRLDLAVGSIGSARSRCLQSLRGILEGE